MHNLEQILASSILIIDDSPCNILLLDRILSLKGYSNVRSSTSAADIVEICHRDAVDLVLLDLHMPGVDGYQALEMVRTAHLEMPVLVFTADVSPEARKRALSLGASDFLTKPGDVTEICLRVHNFLAMHHIYQHSKDESRRLEILVHERTKELQEAEVEILGRLAMAAEYRDDDTGQHTKRVSKMAGQIATALNLPPEESALIHFAALLHDVGKIGIPDAILQKPGKLTRDEYEEMKTHTSIGGKILGQSKGKLLRLAETIALSHHERWDGYGYPEGLAGQNIPIAGRIVAVADSFDAMVNERVYKPAMPNHEAVAEIIRNSGTQFDPDVVAAFMTVIHTAVRETVYPLAA